MDLHRSVHGLEVYLKTTMARRTSKCTEFLLSAIMVRRSTRFWFRMNKRCLTSTLYLCLNAVNRHKADFWPQVVVSGVAMFCFMHLCGLQWRCGSHDLLIYCWLFQNIYSAFGCVTHNNRAEAMSRHYNSIYIYSLSVIFLSRLRYFDTNDILLWRWWHCRLDKIRLCLNRMHFNNVMLRMLRLSGAHL